jgi:ankyrin repeat protein
LSLLLLLLQEGNTSLLQKRFTSLALAAVEGHTEVVELLLGAGADVGASAMVMPAPSNCG